MLDPRFGFVGQRVGGDPLDEREHLYTCKACGEDVDKRDLAAVFHHEEPGHEPLPVHEAERILRVSKMLVFNLSERPKRPRAINDAGDITGRSPCDPTSRRTSTRTSPSTSPMRPRSSKSPKL